MSPTPTTPQEQPDGHTKGEELLVFAPLMLTNLKYSEAIRQMKETGCALRRPHWCSPVLVYEQERVWFDDDGQCVSWSSAFEDMAADDWMMVERSPMTAPDQALKAAVERVTQDAEDFEAPEEGREAQCRRAPCWIAADLRTLLAALSSQADRAELLIDALVQADLTIRSKSGADQSDVVFIRTALSQYRTLGGE